MLGFTSFSRLPISSPAGVLAWGMLLVLACFSTLALPARAATLVSRLDIRIIGTEFQQQKWAPTAQKLIRIRPGDPWEPARLERDIRHLAESGLFSSIHVPDPAQTSGGLALTFDLTPYARVKKIRISGNFPVFRSEVLNVMTLYVGAAFEDEALGQQAERITDLLTRRGFIRPEVRVTAHKDEKDGDITLDVAIEKDEFYRVTGVRFQGNQAIPDSRLKFMSKMWRASAQFGSARRFVQKTLREDVTRLTAFYRKQGFADVMIQAQEKRDETAQQIDLTFDIDEGPKYRIALTGNLAFSQRRLKKELTLFKDGNRNNAGLRRSLKKIKALYLANGFMDARVSYQETTQDAGQRQVLIEIAEGPCYQVNTIDITGNRTISESEIRARMQTTQSTAWQKSPYAKKTVDADIQAIQSLYLKQGFSHARIEPVMTPLADADPSTQGIAPVRLLLEIDEGPRTLVAQTRFQGLTLITAAEAQKMISLRPGEPFRDYMMADDEKVLMQFISEQGYPNCRVKADATVDQAGARITFSVDQGDLVRMGEVIYVGNFRTDPDILDHQISLDPGTPFSLTKLVDSRKRMLDINALDMVRFTPVGLESGTETADVVVEVRERRPYYLEAGFGYDTFRHFYVNAAVGDHNFLGRDLDLQLGGEASQIGYKADLSLTNPAFLMTGINSTSRVYGEKIEEFNKDFGTQSFGFSQKFHQSLMDKTLSLNLGVSLEHREQYLTVQRTLTAEEEGDYDPRRIVMVTPGLVFRTTDSFVRPKKGWLITLDSDLSKGLNHAADDFIRYRTGIRYYFPLSDRLVLAARGRYGLIQPYGNSNRVPDDQLFFLGGTATVRGFDENKLRFAPDGSAVGGREAILASIEARYDLGRNLEFSAFLDSGALRQAQVQGGSDDFRESAGIGLRYMTPVGPIGFLYGWKLDPREGEGRGALHFSMGYTF